MTREEILEGLYEIKNWKCNGDAKTHEVVAEAIKALKQEPNTWSLDDAREDFTHDVYNTLDFLPTNEEANRIIDSFDRVTSSIKQEPTTKNDLGVDAISRAEMLKYQQYLRGKMPNEENYKLWKFIKALPSVTPQEPRWIPVSEKLPEPFTFVNATCRSLVDDRENWVVETVYLPIPKEVNKHGYSDWGNIPMLNLGEAEVIAWVKRIIPQPYKEEVRDKE